MSSVERIVSMTPLFLSSLPYFSSLSSDKTVKDKVNKLVITDKVFYVRCPGFIAYFQRAGNHHVTFFSLSARPGTIIFETSHFLDVRHVRSDRSSGVRCLPRLQKNWPSRLPRQKAGC